MVGVCSNDDGTINMAAFANQRQPICPAFTGRVWLDGEQVFALMTGRFNRSRKPGCYLGRSAQALGVGDGAEHLVLFNDTEVFIDLSEMVPDLVCHKAVHRQCGTLTDHALICAGGFKEVSGDLKVR